MRSYVIVGGDQEMTSTWRQVYKALHTDLGVAIDSENAPVKLVGMDLNLTGFQTPAMGVVDRRNFVKLGFRRVIRGVYDNSPLSSDDEWSARRSDWLSKVKAVLALYARKTPVLYGATALQAMSVALPHGVEDWQHVHILFSDAVDRPKRTDVVTHCSTRPFKVWRTIDGLPLLHPVDHWLQLPRASADEMVEIGDGFVRRRNPLLSLTDMQNRLARLNGRAHAKQAQRALRLVRSGTDSIYETKTRLILVRAGLPTPEVNPEVWCPSIGMPYHVDMGYVDAKLAVEYDGLVHVQDRFQMSFDADRRRNLQDAGWMIITVTAAQLRNPSDIVRSVENALVLRGSYHLAERQRVPEEPDWRWSGETAA